MIRNPNDKPQMPDFHARLKALAVKEWEDHRVQVRQINFEWLEDAERFSLDSVIVVTQSYE
jgi:hypothetical protein